MDRSSWLILAAAAGTGAWRGGGVPGGAAGGEVGGGRRWAAGGRQPLHGEHGELRSKTNS